MKILNIANSSSRLALKRRISTIKKIHLRSNWAPLTVHGRLAVEQKFSCSPHTTAVHNQVENNREVVDVCMAGRLDMSRSGESRAVQQPGHSHET